jgi:hypothetical protein
MARGAKSSATCARAVVSNQTVESRCAWNLDVLDYAFTAEQMIIDTSDGNRPRS